MLKSRVTAYIPIMALMNFAALSDEVFKHGTASLSPTQATMFAGLTSFTNAHFHLHVNYGYSKRSEEPRSVEPHLDLRNSHILGVLRQALIVWREASDLNFAALRKAGLNRKAMVHLDYLFSDWRYMLQLSRLYDARTIIRIMGEDTTTEWELRYYVHMPTPDQYDAHWEEFDAELESWLEACAPFSNIKVVPEVYGELNDYIEEDGEKREFERGVTASSLLFPSWPDDVPWRRFDRVRSDVDMSVAEV
jgi:hypothetical protein